MILHEEVLLGVPRVPRPVWQEESGIKEFHYCLAAIIYLSLAVFLPNRYTTARSTLLGKNCLNVHTADYLTRGCDAESSHVYAGLVIHDGGL